MFFDERLDIKARTDFGIDTHAAWEERNGLVSTIYACTIMFRKTMPNHVQKNVGIHLCLEIVSKISMYTSDTFPYHQKMQPVAS